MRIPMHNSASPCFQALISLMLTATIHRVMYPRMADKKELRIRVSKPLHCVLNECASYLGYSSIAEFVRIAIQEKIRKDCSSVLIEVEETDIE